MGVDSLIDSRVYCKHAIASLGRSHRKRPRSSFVMFLAANLLFNKV